MPHQSSHELLVKAVIGSSRLGLARSRQGGHGEARYGWARRGLAWLGGVLVKAWRCQGGHGRGGVWQGRGEVKAVSARQGAVMVRLGGHGREVLVRRGLAW
jgi:hypothetical protein